MIVDLHTHLVNYKTDFTEPFYSDLARCGISSKEWDYTQQEYLEGTAAADRVVVFGLRGKKTGWQADNENVARFFFSPPSILWRRILWRSCAMIMSSFTARG